MEANEKLVRDIKKALTKMEATHGSRPLMSLSVTEWIVILSYVQEAQEKRAFTAAREFAAASAALQQNSLAGFGLSQSQQSAPPPKVLLNTIGKERSEARKKRIANVFWVSVVIAFCTWGALVVHELFIWTR